MAYQKQTWRDYDDNKTEVVNMNQGAVVTPERLNHMETGIANSADKAEVTAQLAQKASKGNISVSDINKNLGKFDETYMADEFLQQMTGNAPIHSVPADGSLTTAKYADASVTADKISEEAKARIISSKLSNKLVNSNIPTSLEMVTGAVLHISTSGELRALSTYLEAYQSPVVYENHKYYVRFKSSPTSTALISNGQLMYADGSRTRVPMEDHTNDVLTKSTIITADKTSKANIAFTISTGGIVVRESQMMVDLTEVFGIGKEPTLSEFNKFVSLFEGGWFGNNNSIDEVQLGVFTMFNDFKKTLNQTEPEEPEEPKIPETYYPSSLYRTISRNEDIHFLYYDTKNKILYGLDKTIPDTERKKLYASYDYGVNWNVVFEYYTFIRTMYTLESGYHLINDANAKIIRVAPDFSTYTTSTNVMYMALNDAYGIAESNGVILYAEYRINALSKIWRSTDDGVSWDVANDGTLVRHWHAVQADPYTGYFWACGGDTDEQSRIILSKDEGTTWEVMVTGSQQARACGLVFFEDMVMWGMDSAEAEPHVIKIDKNSKEVTVVGAVPHWSTVLGVAKTVDGNLFGWTRVEANNPQKQTMVLFLSDGFEIKTIQTFTSKSPVYVEGYNPGFTYGSMIDDNNIWFGQANHTVVSGLLGITIPTGVF